MQSYTKAQAKAKIDSELETVLETKNLRNGIAARGVDKYFGPAMVVITWRGDFRKLMGCAGSVEVEWAKL